MDGNRAGEFGVDAFRAAMQAPFDAAIAWVGAGSTIVLALSEQIARRALEREEADPSAIGRGMTAYTAGIVTGARLRGREVGRDDDAALFDAVGEAGRLGSERVVSAHCDPVAVAAAERDCAATLARGFPDPAGRLASAIGTLFEDGLAVGVDARRVVDRSPQR